MASRNLAGTFRAHLRAPLNPWVRFFVTFSQTVFETITASPHYALLTRAMEFIWDTLRAWLDGQIRYRTCYVVVRARMPFFLSAWPGLWTSPREDIVLQWPGCLCIFDAGIGLATE